MAFIKIQKTQAEDPIVREHARDFHGLVAELSHEDPMSRRWAARDLAECPEATAALVERLKQERDISVREVIFTSLTHIGHFAAVLGLVEFLHSEDAALRNGAIDALKQMPEEVAPVMHGMLRDADSDVRIFAVNILESLRHPLVESWLIEVIESDPHVNVCATAVDLLGEVGSTAAREALLGLKERFPGEPYVHFAADLALRRIDEG
jgi:HEAT repeat protein